MPVRTTSARATHPQHIHYLRKDVTFADASVAPGASTTRVIGTAPAGAVILKELSGLRVSTVFDGTTLANIGRLATGTLAADHDFYATAMVTTALGLVVLDEVGVTASHLLTEDTTFTISLTSAATTAGVGQVTIAYIPSIV